MENKYYKCDTRFEKPLTERDRRAIDFAVRMGQEVIICLLYTSPSPRD